MLKFKSKPWSTSGIQKSFSVKTKLLSKLIKQKDADFKNETYFKYKQYRKLLSTLLKISKQSCFANYFQTNINDLNEYSKRYQKANISENKFKLCAFCCY